MALQPSPGSSQPTTEWLRSVPTTISIPESIPSTPWTWFPVLELVTQPEDPSQEIPLDKPFFDATTDSDGRFVFESVSPGRYLLGSNIIQQSTSRIPSTYYPGQRSREGAYPLNVRLGEGISDLRFTLPDFGRLREIQICVVDENGRPVPSVQVVSRFGADETGFARLGENLKTDEMGCLTTQGYTRATYSIHAFFRPPGSDFRQARHSDGLVINPGEEPVRRVLVLEGPIGPPAK